MYTQTIAGLALVTGLRRGETLRVALEGLARRRYQDNSSSGDAVDRNDDGSGSGPILAVLSGEPLRHMALASRPRNHLF